MPQIRPPRPPHPQTPHKTKTLNTRRWGGDLRTGGPGGREPSTTKTGGRRHPPKDQALVQVTRLALKAQHVGALCPCQVEGLAEGWHEDAALDAVRVVGSVPPK